MASSPPPLEIGPGIEPAHAAGTWKLPEWLGPVPRILVAGLATDELPEHSVKLCTFLGQTLARADFILIIGNSRGVDEHVAQAFAASVPAHLLEKRLVQTIYPRSQRRIEGATHILARDNEESYQLPLERASAVVLLGGVGGTYETGIRANQQQIPVFPLGKTGDAARRWFDEMEEGRFPIPGLPRNRARLLGDDPILAIALLPRLLAGAKLRYPTEADPGGAPASSTTANAPGDAQRDAPDGFLSAWAIRNLVAENAGKSQETITGQLLLFESSRQHTWLVASEQRMYVVLDDAKTRSANRLIRTSLKHGGVRPLRFDRHATKGVVGFKGSKTTWYYSRHLFPSPDLLEQRIDALLNKTDPSAIAVAST